MQVLIEQLLRSGPGQVAPRFPILQPWLEHSEAGSIIPHWVDKKSSARHEWGPLACASQGSTDSPDTPVLYLIFRKLIFAWKTLIAKFLVGE